jgi:hypothetical protein
MDCGDGGLGEFPHFQNWFNIYRHFFFLLFGCFGRGGVHSCAHCCVDFIN